MQHLQKKLRDIDTGDSHYESKPSAHLTRLIENLSDEQTDKIQYYRKEKWLIKEHATKRDVFLMGQILIDTFKGKDDNHTANAAKFQGKGSKENVKSKGNRRKEDHPTWIPYHTWEYCDKNPNIKDPKGRNERIARRRSRQDKRNGSTSSNTTERSRLKATVAAEKKLLAIKTAKEKAEDMEAA